MLSLGLSIPSVAVRRVGAVSSIATNSLGLASASSQYLSATGKTGINQQKFTFAVWFKTSTATAGLFYFGDGTTANEVIGSINGTGHLNFQCRTASANAALLVSNAVVTDGAWHSVFFAMDTTQATSGNRGIIWLDGAQASLSTNTQPSQNANLSNNFPATYSLGALAAGTANFFNGKLAQVYYIDGQQLTPSSFITGAPGVPKTYSGTYSGNFDFFLPFANAGSLGTDSSGEGNNWTNNNAATQSTDHP